MLLVEQGALQQSGLALGKGHLVAEKGGRGADLEAVGAGLLGDRILDNEAGAVVMLPGEISRPESFEAAQPHGDQPVEEGRLEGREVEPQQFARQGEHCFFGRAAGSQALDHPPLVPHARRQRCQGARQVPGGEGFRPLAPAFVADLRRIADDPGGGLGEVAAQQGGADQVRVAEGAVALLAEEVGDADLLQHVQHVEGRLLRPFPDPPQADFETVAGQMPQAQLVAMIAGGEDAHPRKLQRHRLLRADAGNGNGLAGGGPGILEAGVADLPLGDPENPGELLQQVEGRQSALFHRQVKVFPLATGGVEGQFLDQKVFRGFLETATCAREAAGQIATHCRPCSRRRGSRGERGAAA